MANAGTKRRGRPAVGQDDLPLVRTFLFADLRGYTQFTQEYGDEAAAHLVARFAGISREVAVQHGGEMLESRGDEVVIVFLSVRNALRAALALEARLEDEIATNVSFPLQARMGCDAGEVVPVEGGFRGGALNLAARLLSLAGPGEVFVSESVVHLAGTLPGITYVDRGQARLKGLGSVHVLQAVPADRVPERVTPFEVRDNRPANLTAQPTSFVGRSDELSDIKAMLQREEVHLLTLFGPAGIGKTRLALEVAAEVGDAFSGGVFFVPLAGIADAGLVASTIAGALHVGGEIRQSPEEFLRRHLRDLDALLILDNFEHLLPAHTLVTDLLAACPSLTILVTSRAVLRLAAEHLYAVPPLALPDSATLQAPETLLGWDATALFVGRAQAVRADFQLTVENAPLVVEICNRLEGLPLAIELAAAWLRVLPLESILTRLQSRLSLLIGGARDAPTRHQTLRAAIDWSYDLLEPPEQVLFIRLAVFAGGFTVDAAEAVCAGVQGSPDTLTVVTTLVDRSLIFPVDGHDDEPRFMMLETVREYALDRARQSESLEPARRLHAEHFLRFAEEVEPELSGPNQGAWLMRLEADHDNYRAALHWALENHEIDTGVRLAAALWRFWQAHGHLSEGNRWMENFLALEIHPDTGRSGRREARAWTLTHAAIFAFGQSQFDRARKLAEEALALHRERGDRAGSARALNVLGNVSYYHGRLDEARSLYTDSLALSRETDERRAIAMSLNNLGAVSHARKDDEAALHYYRDSLAVQRELGDTRNIAMVLSSSAVILRGQGEQESARTLLEESLRLRRTLGDPWGIADSLHNLGMLARDAGEDIRALGLYAESQGLYYQAGDRVGCVDGLESIAGILGRHGATEGAARLFGAAEALREDIGVPSEAHSDGTYREDVAVVRSSLGETSFARAWSLGRSIGLEEAGQEAMTLIRQVGYETDESTGLEEKGAVP